MIDRIIVYFDRMCNRLIHIMTETKIQLDTVSTDTILKGDFSIPDSPRGLIIFAHGSGSGRSSPRNRYIAKVLNDNGFATLLTDLLTSKEQESDIKSQNLITKYPNIILNKFNIYLLSERLVNVTRWLIKNVPEVDALPIGYFGSSTGAAAAIVASTSDPLLDKVCAIVSRGGRPDLANVESIKNVKASTLLIVGARDSKAVIDLNKKVLKHLKNAKSKELVMVPNAGHLFEEEGVIEESADITVKWFTNNL